MTKFSSSHRLLFVLRNTGYFRLIEWVILDLLSKGADIHIGFTGIGAKDTQRQSQVTLLAARFPEIRWISSLPKCEIEPSAEDMWAAGDQESFNQARLKPYPIARERFERGLARHKMSRFMRSPIGKIKQRLLGIGILPTVSPKMLESSLDVTPQVELIRKLGITHLVTIPSVSDRLAFSWLVASKRAKISSTALVSSWDNLTIKGRYYDAGAKIVVWGPHQLKELRDYHGILDGWSVGPYPFVHLEAASNQRKSMNLKKSSIRILWLMSSGFIQKADTGETELALLVEALENLRACLGESTWSIVIRPHPGGFTRKQIDAAVQPHSTNLAISILDNQDPQGEQERNAYVTQLQEASVVVGLASTSVLEAGLLNKSTIAPPGALSHRSFRLLRHGEYLLRENGGPVLLAENWCDFTRLLTDHEPFVATGLFASLLGLPLKPSEAVRTLTAYFMDTDSHQGA